MGSQGGAFGRTENLRPSKRNESTGTSARRQNPLNLPRKKASGTVLDLTEGDSSVDSVTRSREQHSSGRYGAAKTSAEGPSELLDHTPIEMSGAEGLGADHAVQHALHGQ
eukprot:7847446-Pyramimonas_sp.AAC.1